MKKIKSKDVTPEHITKVNHMLGFSVDEKVMSDYGYAFYFNQLFVHELDLCDVDRYANLNTIVGYDVGLTKFRSLDSWLWEHSFDLMELSGSDDDKEMLQNATKKQKTKDLDYSKWQDFTGINYTYSFFENGEMYK